MDADVATGRRGTWIEILMLDILEGAEYFRNFSIDYFLVNK